MMISLDNLQIRLTLREFVLPFIIIEIRIVDIPLTATRSGT